MNVLSLLERMVVAMHVPDGFLSAPVAIIWWLITVGLIGLAVNRTSKTLNDRQVPLMGVMAAFIFAAQMLNFPVLGGTSGHLLGGALAALLLGPWGGILVMTCVIALQALLFQDGGLLAMGANIFNMGILTVLAGYAVGTLLLRILGGKKWSLPVAGFIAGWVSVIVAATICSLQLTLSGVPAGVVFPAMLFVHFFIGIGEGLITLAALSFVVGTRPDLVPSLKEFAAGSTARPLGRAAFGGITIVGLLIAIGATLLSPLASSNPDGLERVAGNQGFLQRAQNAPFSILPDYTIPGLDGNVSTVVAGIVGLLIVFALAYGVTLIIRSRNTTKETASTSRATRSGM